MTYPLFKLTSLRRHFGLPLVCVICAIAWTLFPQTVARSHEGDDHEHAVAKVTDGTAHRPTAIPDRIILSLTTQPATSQAVSWRTDDTVARGLAEIAEATAGPEFASQARQLTATVTPLASDLQYVAHYHAVEFTDLKPATKYAYRVGDGTNWSEWIQFQTASDEPGPFTFVYFGDAQNDIKSHWSRVVREAYRDAPKAAFLLHAGDLVNGANNDAEWGEWCYAGGFIHSMTPCVATPGNHEYNEGLSRYWRPTFALPKNGPDGLEETVYWLDYQCARIISLNSNERQQEQVAWLEGVLRDNGKPWTIITFHHPLFSSAEGRDNPELRAAWQPVFDRHKVDIVLQGHDHTYARTQLLTFQNVPTGVAHRSPNSGTMYVVSVSGPKMYKVDRRRFMRRAAQNTQLYQIITVDNSKLRYEARTANGELYDAFVLRKRPGEGNKLIEKVPPTTERLPAEDDADAK